MKRDSSLFCLIYSLGLFSHLETLVGAVSHPPWTMRVKDGEWKIFDEEIKKRRFRWHNGYLLYDKGSVPRTSIWTTYRVQTIFISKEHYNRRKICLFLMYTIIVDLNTSTITLQIKDNGHFSSFQSPPINNRKKYFNRFPFNTFFNWLYFVINLVLVILNQNQTF